MTAEGWTAGPWKVNPHNARVYTEETDTCIARCARDVFEPNYDECLANARLIAAAPELAALVQRYVDTADGDDHMLVHIDRDARALLARITGSAS